MTFSCACSRQCGRILRSCSLDIDDAAIANVGEWPWSRDVMANGLILMREMGAASAVFDIEYVNASPHGLDTQALTSTLPDAFNQEFSQIQTNTQDLVDALRSGRIPSEGRGQVCLRSRAT